jgi:hypothetical protein
LGERARSLNAPMGVGVFRIDQRRVRGPAPSRVSAVPLATIDSDDIALRDSVQELRRDNEIGGDHDLALAAEHAEQDPLTLSRRLPAFISVKTNGRPLPCRSGVA